MTGKQFIFPVTFQYYTSGGEMHGLNFWVRKRYRVEFFFDNGDFVGVNQGEDSTKVEYLKTLSVSSNVAFSTSLHVDGIVYPIPVYYYYCYHQALHLNIFMILTIDMSFTACSRTFNRSLSKSILWTWIIRMIIGSS